MAAAYGDTDIDMIVAAKALDEDVVTNCGLNAIFQKEIASELSIPFRFKYHTNEYNS